jgi:hypothetical protein
MAYLGLGGIIQFNRRDPAPIILPASSLNGTAGYVFTDFDDWMLGELVSLVCPSGAITGYIHKDELSRIYFHTDIFGALANSPDTLIPFTSILPPLVPASTVFALCANAGVTQLQTISTFLATIAEPEYETPIRAWPQVAAAYEAAAQPSEWQIQGLLQNWDLSISGSEADITGISEKFGSYIKGSVTGSGSFNFLVDRETESGYGSPELLIKMAQMTDGAGSTARVRFLLNGYTEKNTSCPFIYFLADVLITVCTINTRQEDAIRGSATFLVNGPIRLLSGLNLLP